MVEHTRRVNEVMDLIIAGMTGYEIHRYIKEKHADWDLSHQSRHNLIKRAMALIAEAAQVDRQAEIGKSLRRKNLLYRRSFVINDYKACLAAQESIDKMLALNAPVRHEVTGKDGGAVDVNHHLPDEGQCDSFLGRVIPALEPSRQAETGPGDDSLPPGFEAPA